MPDSVRRERYIKALTDAAYDCDGKCGLSEQDCYDAHKIHFSARAGGVTHIDGATTDIADLLLSTDQADYFLTGLVALHRPKVQQDLWRVGTDTFMVQCPACDRNRWKTVRIGGPDPEPMPECEFWVEAKKRGLTGDVP